MTIKDETAASSRNIGNQLLGDAASNPRRTEASVTETIWGINVIVLVPLVVGRNIWQAVLCNNHVLFNRQKLNL